MPLLGNLIGDRFTRDVAIDLGTSNVVIHAQGRGLLLNEPCVVALRGRGTGEARLLAVGEEARLMIGKGHRGVSILRPLHGGVIADADASVAMLREFLRQAGILPALRRLCVSVNIPLDCTAIERRAIQQTLLATGASQIQEIEQPIAAALGSDLPVDEPSASMVVDIGGGSTEVGVVSLGGIVMAKSVRLGGNGMDEAIQSLIRRRYGLVAPLQECEKVRIALGAANLPEEDESQAKVKGRNLAHGLPDVVNVTGRDVHEAMSESIRAILDTIREVLERCPPEISGELLGNGLVLTGGASRIKGLDRLIETEMNLPVTLAEDPMSTVALGLGKCMER